MMLLIKRPGRAFVRAGRETPTSVQRAVVAPQAMASGLRPHILRRTNHMKKTNGVEEALCALLASLTKKAGEKN